MKVWYETQLTYRSERLWVYEGSSSQRQSAQENTTTNEGVMKVRLRNKKTHEGHPMKVVPLNLKYNEGPADLHALKNANPCKPTGVS